MREPYPADRADELLELGTPEAVAAAQVYALLAIADAISELKRPADEVPQIPFEQTREGWKW